MPHPTIINDADTVRTDVQRSVEIVEIMSWAILSSLIACRAPSGQEASGGRIGYVEPVPRCAMNGDHPPLDLRKGEGNRDRFGVVIAAVECERHLAGPEVNYRTVASIVIDDCSESTTRRSMQAPFQDVATPWLVLGLRSKAYIRKNCTKTPCPCRTPCTT
jgi:hypothetical protein